MTEDWAWIDAADEPRYSPEEILRVADWLVKEGYAKPGYAETLRCAIGGSDATRADQGTVDRGAREGG